MGDRISQFERATKLSQKQQKEIIYWFGKQNIDIKFDVFKEQRNQYFMLANSNIVVSDTLKSLVAFYLSVNKFYELEHGQNRKNTTLNLNTADKTSMFITKKDQIQPYKEKRERLLNLWSVIQDLKSANYSYRRISVFLKQRHRFAVSHTYIQELWLELEND